MTKDTYVVMRGCKVLGYLQAFSNYHAMRLAERIYGNNLIIERITNTVGASHDDCRY